MLELFKSKLLLLEFFTTTADTLKSQYRMLNYLRNVVTSI